MYQLWVAHSSMPKPPTLKVTVELIKLIMTLAYMNTFLNCWKIRVS